MGSRAITVIPGGTPATNHKAPMMMSTRWVRASLQRVVKARANGKGSDMMVAKARGKAEAAVTAGVAVTAGAEAVTAGAVAGGVVNVTKTAGRVRVWGRRL